MERLDMDLRYHVRFSILPKHYTLLIGRPVLHPSYSKDLIIAPIKLC